MADVLAQGVIAASLEALLPSLCVHCSEPLGGRDLGLCSPCSISLVPLGGARCPHCGGPSEDLDEHCLECLRQPPPQQATVVWGEYDGVLRSAVLAIKQRGRDELVEPLGGRLAGRLALEGWSQQIDAVTAVPSHPLRRLSRGPAAALLLARVVARRLDRPLEMTLRRRGLGRQTGRTRARRLQLSASSFRTAGSVARRRLLVVDDVSTTGATLRRVTEALLDAGADAVFCAVLAQTHDPRMPT